MNRKRATPDLELDIIEQAIERTQNAITSISFVPWKFHPRNATFEPAVNASRVFIEQIEINQKALSNSSQAASESLFNGDESYTLSIQSNGAATLTSNATLGTLRGLVTLEQLFYAHSSGAGVYTAYSSVSISDAPVFGHRGLNLDISRSVYDLASIYRTLDAMATVKFNRLHLHATDSQSWPLEIPSLPELAAKGAFHSSQIISASSLAALQNYGLYRGISVYIEIDSPGHTASIGHAYPDLVSAFQNPNWTYYALEPPAGQVNLNSPAVNEFFGTVLSDLLPRTAPYSPLFHLGTDEINAPTYMLDPSLNFTTAPTMPQLQPYVQAFINNLLTYVQAEGLTPLFWEEAILDWNLTFPANLTSKPIIQTWQSAESLLAVLERGHRALFGPTTPWYLDCGLGTYLVPVQPPLKTQLAAPYLDYCSPVNNWKAIYTFDPLANITEEYYPQIEGGEVHIWSEETDSVTLDERAWPRAAAAAEVMWKGARQEYQIKEASGRLAQWRERIVIQGVQAGTAGEIYCFMGESNCDY